MFLISFILFLFFFVYFVVYDWITFFGFCDIFFFSLASFLMVKMWSKRIKKSDEIPQLWNLSLLLTIFYYNFLVVFLWRRLTLFFSTSTHFFNHRKIKPKENRILDGKCLWSRFFFPTHRMTRFVFARWRFDTHIYRQYHFLYQ